ncbi:MAG: ABC transporter ATP-binding protein [Opitutales bacterium]
MSIRNLTVERDQILLRDVSWTVKPGEHWAILGPNGSGKTSLLNAVCGYLTPSRGQISVGDAHYGHRDWRKVRQQIGLASGALQRRIEPQEFARDVVLSGTDASLNYWATPSSAENARADELLAEFGMAAAAARPWRLLSEGERARCLIARALFRRPRLLVLDEPCAGLDPVARQRLLLALRDLCASTHSMSLVLVTHHVEEIIPGITHVLLLSGGRVVSQGLKEGTLISALLSRTYGTEVSLSEGASGYRLEVKAPA